MVRFCGLAVIATLSLAVVVAPAVASAASPKPVVSSLTSTFSTVPAGGANVTVKARVHNATTCLFTEARGAKIVASKAVSCTSGAASTTLVAAANTTQTAVTLRFAVKATSATGTSAVRTIHVVQAARVGPLQLVSTGALASGTVNVAYSTTLLAFGGTAPYTWAIISGELPVGLALGADGSISGIPTVVTQSTITVRVADSTSQTATATMTIAITDPPTTMDRSVNWSGYTLNGGPFTSASGTFTVPSLTTTSPNAEVAEWVGIDGATNQDLIQAGVLESYNPRFGTTTAQAWWEILPDFATNISLPVQPGNTVTVTITQGQGTQWTIRILNESTGQSFTTTQSYAGAATSAEWILEAPTSSRDGQEPLGAFTPTVMFSHLQFTGTVTGIDQVTMAQSGVVVATPSALSATGFTVAYGSSAPAAP